MRAGAEKFDESTGVKERDRANVNFQEENKDIWREYGELSQIHLTFHPEHQLRSFIKYL